MAYAPVVLFTYNRPKHTSATIKALLENPEALESELIVFSDGAKSEADQTSVLELRKYLKSIKGFKKVSIIERNENLGLAKSIISGVTEFLKQNEKIIVLEDDLITSPFFLRFMNDGLEFYKDETMVSSIHGYVFPVSGKLPETFFVKGADCWGWATWARGWKLFEPDGSKLLKQIKSRKLEKRFDREGNYPYVNMLENQVNGKVNSWAIRWRASTFLADTLTLLPGRSLVKNIGFDGSGTNSGNLNCFDPQMASQPIQVLKIPIEEATMPKLEIENYFKKLNLVPDRSKSFIEKIRNYILKT